MRGDRQSRSWATHDFLALGGMCGCHPPPARAGHEDAPCGDFHRRWKRYVPLALTICMGVGFSLAVFAVVRGWETRHIHADFRRAAEDRCWIVRRAIEANLHVLESIHSLYAASITVERHEFREFVKPLLSRHRSILGLEWIPRIPQAQRSQYEAAARHDGFADFQITQRDAQQRAIPALPRDEYFPVYFVEPYQRNKAALGFDLASEGTRQAALRRSRDTGKPVATARIRLVQETDPQFGFCVFLPVYGKGMPTDTVNDRRGSLQGFVSGVFRIADIVESGPAPTIKGDIEGAPPMGGPQGIDVHLYDQTAPAGRRLLYCHASATPKQTAVPSGGHRSCPSESAADELEPARRREVWGPHTPAHLAEGLHQTIAFEVGGRRWSMLCTPAPGFVAAGRTWQPWAVLAAGLIFTGLLAAYFLAGIGRTAHMHRLVDEQTSQLRASEEKLAGLVDSLGDHISMIDEQYTIVWANHVARRVFRPDLVGKKCHLAYHGSDEPCQRCVVRETFLDGKVHEHETEVVTADGTERIFWCTANVTARHADGRPKMVVEVSRDITARKQATEALEHSARQWDDTFDAIQDAVCLLDQEGRFLRCNVAMGKLVGKSPCEIVGERCCEIVHGTPKPIEGCPLVRTRHTLQRETLESRLGDRWFSILADPMLDERGQFVGCVHIISDITERKSVEEELKGERNKLQATMAAMEGGVTIQDREYNVVYQNRFLEERFGGLGEKCYRVYEAKEETCEGCPVEKAFGDGKCHTAERKVVMPNGEITYWDNTASPIRDATGEIVCCVELVKDITEHKQAEAELASARAAAEAANRAKSEFLANMSHEIRTPMTAILGFADLLLQNLEEPQNVEAANTIKRNGKHLLQIINDVLDLSKIEAGRLQIEQISCSPHQIVAEVVSLMRVRADVKGLPLVVEYSGPTPETIITDPTRLRQILVNLIGNAIKFTEVGSVRVVTRLVADADQEPKLTFDVIDTGIGIAKEEIAGIFEPFTQGDASTTRKFGGSGLGLAISKRLARLLGGDVTVASAAGRGSTFSVTVATGPLDGVPLLQHPAEAALAARPSKQTPPDGPPKLDCRVLLAEDGPDNQRLISLLLRKAGAEVTIAQNGQETLEKALATYPGWGRRWSDPTEPFDVILMDMQMPLLDGYEATRRLRAAGYTGPVIALTAHAMSDDRQKCLDAGCDDYLAKPIDREKLVEMVAKHAEAPRHPADAAARPAPDGG
jgi:PAS domain S-box-containing protein